MNKPIAMLSAAALALGILSGCGPAASAPSTSPSAAPSPAAPQESAQAEQGVFALSYSNVNFDFSKDIAQLMDQTPLVPQQADIPLTVADEKGASGVILVPSVREDGAGDYYLNALVAGNALQFTATADIARVESSVSGGVEVQDNAFSLVPAPIVVGAQEQEVITVTMADGQVYRVHTAHELAPVLNITTKQVAEENAGVYDFALDKFLLRVNTEGEVVYYRNLNCVGEKMAENFARQETAGGDFYTTFVELNVEYRNMNGGYSSGLYLVMDENYADVDTVTLLPNAEEHHTHGEGYLDQHEFVVLGKGHYLTMSYTPMLVENLPEGVQGIDGGSSAYVWAGIFQEVQDGKVRYELNTTDYPMLYETAVEKLDYANSTDQGIDAEDRQGNTIHVFSEGFMDYVHPNSIDYTLDGQGNVDKLLVSMRDQCAVYQFDLDTGAVEWVLGGKASTFTGYEAYATQRKDEKGVEFTALSYGQHDARYLNKNADGTLTGNPRISMFDNQTGDAPFRIEPPAPTMAPNLTRTLQVELNVEDKTATVSHVINGVDLNALSQGYHIASHCGSVAYDNDNAVVIGWGLHGVVDGIGAAAPAGTITDKGYEDLRQGSRPVFTEYDLEHGTITFELYATRNPLIQSHEALFAYRTYKSGK